MLRLLTRLSSAALLLSLAACASSKQRPSDALVYDESDVLISTRDISTRPSTVLQRIRGKHGTQDVTFECVVELSRTKLTVIGMTPYNARAFVLEQEGVDVKSRGGMVRDVTFAPLQLLYDLHRVFYRGLSGPQADGAHEVLDHGEVVREVWKDGHVVQRRFHSLDTSARLRVIEFDGAPAPVIAPRVRYTDVHYGYSLDIENVTQGRLDEGYSLAVEKKRAR